mgnify:CR=1 FL=1
MAQQIVQDELVRDTNVVAINALKRPGPRNELGVHQSFIGLLAAWDRIKFRRGGGTVAARLKYTYASTGTAEHYSKNDPAQPAGNESVKAADVDYAFVRDVIDVHNFDEAASEGSQHDTDESLVSSKLITAKKNIVSILETALVTGDGTNNKPQGLDFWINDASVYGSINQATDSWAASTVVDAASAALSHNHLREAQEGATDDNGARIDVIISSQRQADKYKQLMDGRVEFTTMMIADIEFRGFMYDGIPWIILSQFPKGDIYGLTMSELTWLIMLQKDNSEKGMVPLAEMEHAGLPFAVRPIDAGGVDSNKGQVTMYHSFWVDRQFKCWRIENLSQTL